MACISAWTMIVVGACGISWAIEYSPTERDYELGGNNGDAAVNAQYYFMSKYDTYNVIYCL